MKKERLNEIFEESVTKNECLLVDVIYRGSQDIPVVEIFIDNKDGVTTKICADIARELNEIIEEENLLRPNYRLEVSSPGVERPLKFLVQYHKHIDRKMEIVYLLNDNEEIFSGKLKSINGNTLIFDLRDSVVEIEFETIKSAKVLISF